MFKVLKAYKIQHCMAHIRHVYWKWGSVLLLVGVYTPVSKLALPLCSSLKISNSAVIDVTALILAFCAVLIVKRPRMSFKSRIKGRDASIEVLIGDLFDSTGDWVIPTNINLETTRIAQGSLIRQYLEKSHFDAEALHLQMLSSLPSGPLPRHIGEVAKISEPGGKNIYFLVMSQPNDYGCCQPDLNRFNQAVQHLFLYIEKNGEIDELNIPVLGTGHTRIPTIRIDMAKRLIDQIIASYGAGRHYKKIRLVIWRQDFMEDHLTVEAMEDLKAYLEMRCRHPQWGVFELSLPTDARIKPVLPLGAETG